MITVLGNDYDPDFDPLAIVSVGQTPNGVVTNNITSVAYLPNTDFSGTDSFTYTISDGSLMDTATVAVTVTAVNDPPVAGDDLATTNQDVALPIDVVTASDFDVDGNLDPSSIIPTAPSSGLAVAGPAGIITYTPNPGFSGVDSFNYQICDVAPPVPAPLCDTAAVTVTVIDTPPAPPTNLRAAAGDGQVSLGWDHTPEVDLSGYRVYRADGGGPFNFVATTPVITRYIDQPLINGTTYVYTVTAIDVGSNESGPSNSASALPNPIAISHTTVVTCSGAVVTNCGDSTGMPDNIVTEITGTGQIILDFDPLGTGDGIIDGIGFDIVYYEFLDTSNVFLDYVTVDLSPDGTTWYTLFEWNGDSGATTDVRGTNIDSMASDADGELENEDIPLGLLYPFPGTGVAIDIGNVLVPPPGGVAYRFVRISYPAGGSDAAQIDSVERLN